MSLFEKTRSWYGRFERPISSLSLIGGFLFDAVALKRVDTLWENIWILIHIVVVGVFIVLVHLKENESGDEGNPTKAHFWFVNILQFFFGGILSAFLVFYFRSTDIWVTWPFLLVLALAFWANESLKRHYMRLSFQISLFFLSIYSFAIFLMPVILHRIDTHTFIISGLVSLASIIIFIGILFFFIKDKFKDSRRIISLSVSGIFVLVNFLYFTNLIPPIPLSLKEAGVYHSIQRNGEGNYNITYEENNGWKDYFKLYPDFKKTEGSPVYAYSAIFSPRALDTVIVHEWQYFDEVNNKWVTDATIRLNVVGGRDGGFRTYSMRSNLSPHKWRVNIKTEQGKTIGHLRFNLVSVNTDPLFKEEVKE